MRCPPSTQNTPRRTPVSVEETIDPCVLPFTGRAQGSSPSRGGRRGHPPNRTFNHSIPSGAPNPASRLIASALTNQPSELPSVRAIRRPSSSRITSSGVLPCTMHQYPPDTSGWSHTSGYLFSASSAAVVLNIYI